MTERRRPPERLPHNPRLLLVRHAMPVVDPAVPAALWHLGDAGRDAARRLRPFIPAGARFVASTEPKAVETLRELAGDAPIATDAGFAEVRRPDAWGAGYRATARSYVEGAGHDGWEPHVEVVARFDAAVRRHCAAFGPTTGTLVVGTHGLACTLWLAGLGLGSAEAEPEAEAEPQAQAEAEPEAELESKPGPGAFWESLRFPDLIAVDPASLGARRIVGG
ncbi:histidine phosphatase family protein [Actinoplanes sp. CA-030573]|uniref:histidine phosphatase family protein n=1 Tax=Actinoplanes sp. CA-030573 TaxID=3239898 RepID=UPI003D900BE5